MKPIFRLNWMESQAGPGRWEQPKQFSEHTIVSMIQTDLIFRKNTVQTHWWVTRCTAAKLEQWVSKFKIDTMHNINFSSWIFRIITVTVVVEFGFESALSSDSKSSRHGIRFAGPARVHDPSESSRHWIRVRVSGPVYHPSESESHRIRVPCRVGGPVYSPSKSSRHRILFAGPLEPMIHPGKASRHRTRVRASGPVYHPLENSSHRIRVRVGRGPVCPPGAIHGRHRTIISSYRNSEFIYFGSPKRPRLPSVSSTQPISGIHPNPVTAVIKLEFRLSIIHKPGPRLAHRSLDPPSEGAPSTDLVNDNILRFRLSSSHGASHAWSCCDDA